MTWISFRNSYTLYNDPRLVDYVNFPLFYTEIRSMLID